MLGEAGHFAQDHLSAEAYTTAAANGMSAEQQAALYAQQPLEYTHDPTQEQQQEEGLPQEQQMAYRAPTQVPEAEGGELNS